MKSGKKSSGTKNPDRIDKIREKEGRREAECVSSITFSEGRYTEKILNQTGETVRGINRRSKGEQGGNFQNRVGDGQEGRTLKAHQPVSHFSKSTRISIENELQKRRKMNARGNQEPERIIRAK